MSDYIYILSYRWKKKNPPAVSVLYIQSNIHATIRLISRVGKDHDEVISQTGDQVEENIHHGDVAAKGSKKKSLEMLRNIIVKRKPKPDNRLQVSLQIYNK